MRRTGYAVDEAALDAPVEDRVNGGRSGTPQAVTSGAHPRYTYERARLALDALMLAAAAGAAALTAPAADVPVEDVSWLISFGVLTLALLATRGAYRRRTVPNFLEDARLMVAATAVAALSVAFIRVVSTDDVWAASQTIREWVFATAYLIGGRGGLHLAEVRARRRGVGLRPVLIVGAGEVGHLIGRRLLANPGLGLKPVGFVDADPREVSHPAPLPVLGTDSEVEDVVRERHVERAIFSFSRARHEVQLPLIRRLSELGLTVSIIPRLFEGVPDRMTLDRVEGLPLVSIYPSDPRSWQFAVKYGLDRLLALVAIIVLSPILLMAAAGVLLTLGRPILFRQRRVGLDGREFQMAKFRTLPGSPDTEGEADAEWAARISGQPYVPAQPADAPERRPTRFGWLLRHCGVDELPQLFNVLRGEMSMVGPRPERRSYVELFEQSVQRYVDRHRVKSGITGWAQVHGLRGQTSLVDRVEWDNYYIENWSLWLDLKIVLLTFVAVFRGQGD